MRLAMELPITRDARTIQPSSRDVAPRDALRAPDEGPASSEAPEAEEGAAETRYKTHRRFDRAARLFGEPGLRKLMEARVLVIGVGGVGSFTAEALARSGVGNIALIDFDRVCVTNTNRQLHAMQGTIGKRKVEVMAARLKLVHPTSNIEAVPTFYNAESSDELLSGRIDYVVDAIDNLTAKAHLIATCLERKLPLVSSMGAAARLDPTAVRVADLAATYKDPFAAALRKLLRSRHGLSLNPENPVGVQAVFSPEEPIAPSPLGYDEGEGFRCVCPGGKNGLNDCDRKNRIDGTASFVTGAFGLTAASVVVRALIGR
jgi:tRNA A37 threonylcarbamoyladenosine dehydratase